jgi:signal transduction histidine kinase
MVPADAGPQEQRLAERPPDGAALSVGQLAHELNSLLDGSLRTIGLALRRLEPASGEPGPPDEVAARLQMVRDAMWQMAEVLERAMQGSGQAGQVLRRDRPLLVEIPRLLALVRPLADPHNVVVEARIAPEAEDVPVGQLWPVLLNGLRNAVQACVRAAGEPRRAELRVAVEGRRTLVIRITDTGPGPPGERDPDGRDQPAGHGLGLGVCRQVVAELGGRLTLTGRADAGGAELRVEVPLRSLVNP